MTKRKNPFVRTKQYYVDDEGDMNWWIDEEDLEEFKRIWLDDLKWEDIHKGGEDDVRTLNGKEYNEWMIGNTWGDYEGNFVDEDCPKCEHLLVVPSRHEDYFTGEERHCSDYSCDYGNKAWEDFSDKSEAEWKDIRDPNKHPAPKFKIEGETLDEFCERTGLQLDHKLERKSDSWRADKNGNPETKCVVCKEWVPMNDYYISFGYAIVDFAHKETGCTNGGPSIAVPFSPKEKEYWGKII